MRLIDADALPRHKQLEAFGNGQYEDVEIVYGNDIDNAPTIDPFNDKSLEQLMDECFNRGYQKAIRHGRWDWQGVGVFCSKCHYKLQTTGLPSYCPNCGARMERSRR